MTNEEIKALMLELVRQVNKVGEIIHKINENSMDEIDKNSNYNTPHVLSLRIACDRHKDSVVSDVHCCDVLKVMGLPEVVEKKLDRAYPYEVSVEIDGVRLFELTDEVEE